MAILKDGREVPDHYSDIGVFAPGGGTAGITRAGQQELTRQRSTNISLPTRILGAALGAAETVVPVAGSPHETVRAMAKAAKDYIVHGIEQGFTRAAFDIGTTIGNAAVAGDPHAQGAAFAALASTAAGAKGLAEFGHPMTLTPTLERSAAAPGLMETQAARIGQKLTENAEPAADVTYQRMLDRRAQRAIPPDYTGPQRRAGDAVQGLATLARKRQAELQAQGFIGTGPESMTPEDVLKTKIIGGKRPK